MLLCSLCEHALLQITPMHLMTLRYGRYVILQACVPQYIINSSITLKFTHQLTDDKFLSVGIDGDVCIEAELNNFGVVYVFNQCIKCSTCKKGQACLHVQHILSLLKSAEDGINELHPVLQLLSDQLSTEKSVPTCSSSLMCLSNTPIPFEVPSHLKHVSGRHQKIALAYTMVSLI